MNRSRLLALALPAALVPFFSPAPVLCQAPPNSVFIEALTWEEIRDEIDAGSTTIIIPTAGTEQKGPHMVMGEHKYVMEYTMDELARLLGNALVSPIMTYVPEGNWGAEPTGHMRMPGTITLPEDWFRELLVHTAKSHAAGGFTDILFIGDSGGNQRGMSAVTEQLNAEWAGTAVRAHFIGDYYAKSNEDITGYMKARGFTDAQIGSHAGLLDTSQMLFVNPHHVRMDKAAPDGGFEGSGVSGDPSLSTAALGEAQLRIKINNALAQIQASLAAR
ncbi:MAG: creatininase family protein [Gemmatimonadetes bacterium]|jgi:creatinine amidohydrolase|nr:creatininase family protein [Gemmatimonadota bacterium]